MFGDMARSGLVIPADIDQLLVTVFPHAFNLSAGCMNTVLPLFAGEANEAFGEEICGRRVVPLILRGGRDGGGVGNTSSLPIKNFP